MTEAEQQESSRRSRPTRRFVFRVLGVAVLLAVVYFVVIAMQVVSASRDTVVEHADAIVVLGAAQYDGQPSPVLQRRLDHAHELYTAGTADQIVLTGAKQPSDRFTEAYAGYVYLIGKGISESALVIVDDGFNTYDSLAAAARVLRNNGHSTVVLVSDRYHNRRLNGVAAEVGLQAQTSSVGPSPGIRKIASETLRVGVGEIFGYRRVMSRASDFGI